LSRCNEVELMSGDMVALLLDESSEEENTTAEGVFMYRTSIVEHKDTKSYWFYP
jgi:hypothetical protein